MAALRFENSYAYIVGGFRGRHANQATTSSTPSGAKGQKLARMLTMS
jgi:hypothetical protein